MSRFLLADRTAHIRSAIDTILSSV